MKLAKINTSMVVAGSAVLISACALLISIQEMHIMRTQQKALMYPYVTTDMFYNGVGFGFRIKNSGNGLAKVNSYQLYSDDGIYFDNWLEVTQHYMPEVEGINYNVIQTAGNIRNEMIVPRDEVTLFFLNWTPEIRKYESSMRSLNIKVCYSSLLGEHWEIIEGIPTPVEEACQPDPQKEFDR